MKDSTDNYMLQTANGDGTITCSGDKVVGAHWPSDLGNKSLHVNYKEKQKMENGLTMLLSGISSTSSDSTKRPLEDYGPGPRNNQARRLAVLV